MLCAIFPFYNRKSAQIGRDLSKRLLGLGVEDLEYFVCACQTCPVEVMVARCTGGFVSYAKVHPKSGVQYSHVNHDVFD